MRNFVLLGKLGQGSFSEVHKVRRVSDGRIYALKRVPIEDNADKTWGAKAQGARIRHKRNQNPGGPGLPLHHIFPLVFLRR